VERGRLENDNFQFFFLTTQHSARRGGRRELGGAGEWPDMSTLCQELLEDELRLARGALAEGGTHRAAWLRGQLAGREGLTLVHFSAQLERFV